jgi:hypothetical protein
MLGGPQSRPGPYGEEKNLVLPGIEPRPSNPYPIAIPIELSRFPIIFHIQTQNSDQVIGIKMLVSMTLFVFTSVINFPSSKLLQELPTALALQMYR